MAAQLYRHFDADGRLLYVGISLNALARLSQHSLDASWFKDIRLVTIEVFDTRLKAAAAERKAIRSERPMWNVAHARSGARDRAGSRGDHTILRVALREAKVPERHWQDAYLALSRGEIQTYTKGRRRGLVKRSDVQMWAQQNGGLQ